MPSVLPFTARRLLAAAAVAVLCGATQAHQIWFEPAGRGLTFRYGELDTHMH